MKDSLEPFNVMRHKRWETAPRVPAIATFLFPTAMAVGGFAAFAALTATYIGVTLVASWAINALMPKPSFGSGSSQGLLTNTRDATGVQNVVYGELRKGGTITYLEATGTNNEYLHMIISIAGHEINSFEQFFINDDAVTLDSDGFVTGSDYADADGNKKILIKEFTGASNQNVYNVLNSTVTDGPSWAGKQTGDDTNFRGQGVACFYVRMQYDQNVFAQGVPLFTTRIKGKKVFDPRTSTTTYSSNAALCVRDYLVSKYGLNSSGDINEITFTTAANVCDEDVTLDAGGTENRYECHGSISLDQAPGDILADLMTSCQGSLFWGQGKWHLKAGDYNASVETFTLDDFRGPITLDTKHSRRNNFNIVRGTFNDAANGYIRADYPEIKSTTFISDDNNIESAIDLSLPFTTSGTMAQRLATLTLFRSREQLTISADFSLRAFDVEVGDVVAITNPRYGFSAKEFEVVGWRFFNDGNAGDQRINLRLRETSSAAYNWNADETSFTNNNSTLPTPGTNLAITNLQATGGGFTQGDGTFINSVILSWDAPTNIFINHYEVEYKVTTDSNYAATTTGQTSIELSPIVDGTQYSLRVRSVTADGRTGPFANVVFTAGGDTVAPSPITSLTATGGQKQIELDWTAPTTQVGGGALHDLKGYNIYRHSSNSQPASPISFTGSDRFVDAALSINTQYYYWVSAVDFTGNESAVSSSVNATTDAASTGVDTDTSVYTGILYYTTIQASAPSAPTANSGTFNVTSKIFTTPPTGYSHAQTGVANTSFAVKEWTVSYTVIVDVSGSVQSITYGSVNGAFQITDTIESDNFQTGSQGWRIHKDGSAEFGSAVIRGTLSVGQVPDLTASKITDLGSLATQSNIAAGDVAGLATVATTGSFNNLSNQPTIPSNTSDLNNDDGFQTASQVSSAVASGTSGLATTTALNSKNSVHVGTSGPSGTPNDYDLWYYTPDQSYYYYLNNGWNLISIQAYSIATSYLAAIQINASQITAGTITADRFIGSGIASVQTSAVNYSTGGGQNSNLSGTAGSATFSGLRSGSKVLIGFTGGVKRSTTSSKASFVNIVSGSTTIQVMGRTQLLSSNVYNCTGFIPIASSGTSQSVSITFSSTTRTTFVGNLMCIAITS